VRQQFVGEVGTFGVTFPHICCMPKTMKSVDFSQSYSEIKEGVVFEIHGIVFASVLLYLHHCMSVALYDPMAC